jgi:hypothetical protein
MAQEEEGILAVSEPVPQAEVEARKRARAEAEGEVVDLTRDAPDADEAARVDKAAARAREADADAAARLLLSGVKRNCAGDVKDTLRLLRCAGAGLACAREALRAARARGHARCVAALENAGVVALQEEAAGAQAQQQRGSGGGGGGAGPSAAAPAQPRQPRQPRLSERATALQALLRQASVRCARARVPPPRTRAAALPLPRRAVRRRRPMGPSARHPF